MHYKSTNLNNDGPIIPVTIGPSSNLVKSGWVTPTGASPDIALKALIDTGADCCSIVIVAAETRLCLPHIYEVPQFYGNGEQERCNMYDVRIAFQNGISINVQALGTTMLHRPYAFIIGRSLLTSAEFHYFGHLDKFSLELR